MKFFLFLCSVAIAAAQDEAKDSIRRYEGMIGENLPISLILSAKESDTASDSYTGSYHYRKAGIPISLTPQESKNDTAIFHENEHWDGEKDAFTGKWRVKIDGDTITGTWSSSDGKKSLPIQLKESYPAGSFRAEVFHFESSWTRKRDREEIGQEKSISFLQFKGDAPGLAAVNSALRQIAWESASISEEEEKPEAPAEITIAAIEKAIIVKPPEKIDWEATYRESHESSMDVVMNESGLLCISLLSSSYTGGAHGNYGISHVTFDTETGKQLKIADLVTPGFEKRWADLGAAEIRTNCGQKPDSPLTESGLFEDKLELNENWFLTPGGIGFSYDPYEIASYAQGIVEFTLPWKSIARDLKPGTRIADLAKSLLEKAK